jgi:hypothetical protein
MDFKQFFAILLTEKKFLNAHSQILILKYSLIMYKIHRETQYIFYWKIAFYLNFLYFWSSSGLIFDDFLN